MFHVSTMLPFTPNDEQQIQRKRHIGNDLVSLVFIDMKDQELSTSSPPAPTPTTCRPVLFDPRSIKSHFLHVYVVVQEVPLSMTGYRLSSTSTTPTSVKPRAYFVYTTSLNNVPTFSPTLPDPPIFLVSTTEDRLRFRNFLLAKLMNAECAAYEAPRFRGLHQRTFQSLLENVVKDYGEVRLPKAKAMLAVGSKIAHALSQSATFLAPSTAGTIDSRASSKSSIGRAGSTGRVHNGGGSTSNNQDGSATNLGSGRSAFQIAAHWLSGGKHRGSQEVMRATSTSVLNTRMASQTAGSVTSSTTSSFAASNASSLAASNMPSQAGSAYVVTSATGTSNPQISRSDSLGLQPRSPAKLMSVDAGEVKSSMPSPSAAARGNGGIEGGVTVRDNHQGTAR